MIVGGPICIECGESVDRLYKEYSPGNVSITKCPNCGNVADKYVEFEGTILFIDMLLHKHQVSRHLLYNRIPFVPSGIDQNVFKLWIFLVSIEVHMKWFLQEEWFGVFVAPLSFPLHFVYLFVLTALESLVLCAGACLLLRGLGSSNVRNNYVFMALTISGFGKLLVILMFVWEYNRVYFQTLVNGFVILSNTKALVGYLGNSRLESFACVMIGNLGKILFQLVISSWIDPTYPIYLV